jgi:hypothetical protein
MMCFGYAQDALAGQIDHPGPVFAVLDEIVKTPSKVATNRRVIDSIRFQIRHI